MSDEPCPTMRTSRASRRAHRRRDAPDLRVLLEQATECGRLLPDLREEARAGLGAVLSRRHALSPPTRVRTTSRVSSRTTTSAGPPGARRPTVGSPRTRAGTLVAASSARSSGHVDRDEVAHRLDHRQRAAGEHAVLAPHDVVARRRSRSRRARTSRRRGLRPAIASVTSERRPAPTRQRSRTMSGSRWTPSTIAWRTTSGRTSAAPTMPGSRCASGRIALNTCVTARTPRSNAACASRGGGVRVPEGDDDARDRGGGRRARARREAPARASRGAHGPRRAAARAAPGRGRGARRDDASRAARVRGTAPRGGRRGFAAREPHGEQTRSQRSRSASSEVISVGR